MKYAMWRVMSLCILLITSFTLEMAYGQEMEPNDSFAEAQEIALDATITGDLNLENNGDVFDHFFVVIPEDGNVTASLTLLDNFGVYIRVFDKAGTQFGSQYGTSGSFSFTETCFAADTIYIQLDHGNQQGGYGLTVSQTSLASANDSEPNNSFAEVSSFVSTSDMVTGHLGYYDADAGLDADDYFGVILPENGSYTFRTIREGGLNHYIRAYYKNGSSLGSQYSYSDTTYLTLDCLAPDTIYVHIDRFNGCGGYALDMVNIDPPSHTEDVEPNNSLPETNTYITYGETTSGHIGYYDLDTGEDDFDYIGIILPEDGNYAFRTIKDPEVMHYLRIFYKNGTAVTSEFSYTDTTTAIVNCLQPDTVYARIDHNSGCGGYTLSSENILPASVPNDAEVNDTQAQTNTFISEGESTTGHIGYYHVVNGYDTYDWIGVVLPEDGNYAFRTIKDPAAEHYIRVYNKLGTQLTSQFSYSDTTIARVDCLAEDTVYIRIDRYAGCGGYTLDFENELPASVDIDVEDNDSQAQTNTFLSAGDIATGHIGYIDYDTGRDNFDWFGVILPEDGSYSFQSIKDPAAEHYLRVYYKSGTQAGSEFSYTDTTVTVVSCLQADTVYVRVDYYSGCGGYTLSFDASPLSYANDSEANNSIATAQAVETGDIITGHLGYIDADDGTDNADYFEFQVVEAPFELELEGELAESLQAYIRIKNEAGTNLTNTFYGGGVIAHAYTITTPGTYYVNIQRYAGCGSYSLGDICGLYPAIPSITADGPLAFCDGESVNLTSTPESTYLWSTGETSQTINVSETGEYSVKVKDVNGCPAESATTSVTVYPLPAAPIITADGSTEFCEGGSVMLTSTAEAAYLWSTGETTQSIEVSESGNYSVTVTDANGCSQASASVEVIVNPLPAAPMISNEGEDEFCEGESTTMTSTAAAAYLWNTGATTQSIEVTMSGDYSLTITDENGCTAMSGMYSITVLPNTIWYADTDGDGFGDAENSIAYCEQLPGYVMDDTDCDDTDEDVYPGAEEICDNGIDDDCDGETDEDCGTDCSAFATAPVDLSKSMAPVPWPDGDIDRVQLKWYKASPKVKYTAEDNAACDIQYWPVQSIDHAGDHFPLPEEMQDTTLIPYTTVQKDNGNPLFKWPIKFRFDGGQNPVQPSTSYRWRVRCYCDQGALVDGAQVVTPWSELKTFNTPAFDPETGIYTPPATSQSNGLMDKMLGGAELEMTLYPNPNDGRQIQIQMKGEVEGAYQLRIVDMTGKLVYSDQHIFNKDGLMQLDLGAQPLNDGMYMLSLTQSERVHHYRFMVR